MNEERSTDGVIAVFVPGLQNTPGWLTLSRKKQDALLEITSRNMQHRQLKRFSEFGELLDLYEAQRLLEGEQMTMRDYLSHIYPDRDYRTITRKQAAFAELVKNVSPAVLDKISASNTKLLEKFTRIVNADMGRLRTAVKELAALPASTEQSAEKYLEALDAKLLDNRQAAVKGKKLHANEEFAVKMATNAVLNYMRSCALKSTAQRNHFLRRVCGWVMEAQAMPGTIHIHRMPIPDGVLIRRGRPRKHPSKEAA